MKIKSLSSFRETFFMCQASSLRYRVRKTRTRSALLILSKSKFVECNLDMTTVRLILKEDLGKYLSL